MGANAAGSERSGRGRFGAQELASLLWAHAMLDLKPDLPLLEVLQVLIHTGIDLQPLYFYCHYSTRYLSPPVRAYKRPLRLLRRTGFGRRTVFCPITRSAGRWPATLNRR